MCVLNMGLFRKKKKMIDLRDLQKKGIMKLPVRQAQPEVTTDKDGFIQAGQQKMQPMAGMTGTSGTGTTQSSGGSFLNFMDSSSLQSSNQNSISSMTTPSEDLRKISAQISDLDNKIYKLEQRIELLERKVGVGSGGGVSGGMW
jgi:hypothetical protein